MPRRRSEEKKPMKKVGVVFIAADNHVHMTGIHTTAR